MNSVFRTSLITSFILTAIFVVLLYPFVLIKTLYVNDLVLVSLSTFPGFLIMALIYFLDKQDKEPIWLLAIAFILGAINLLLDINILDVVLSYNEVENRLLNTSIEALSVATTEEMLKWLVVMVIIYPNKYFDEPFDGIVYAVFVGLGFAIVENLTFVLQGSATLAIMRMFTAVPAHFVFAVIMGYYLGKAKCEKKSTLLFVALSILIPILFHTAYDFFFFIDFIHGVWIGGIITLIIAVFLAKNSIIAHMHASALKK